MITQSLMTSPHRLQRLKTPKTQNQPQGDSVQPQGLKTGTKRLQTTPKNQKTAKHSTQPQRFKSATVKRTTDSKQSKKDLKRPRSLKITTKQVLRGSK